MRTGHRIRPGSRAGVGLGAVLALALLVPASVSKAEGAPVWDYEVVAEYPHEPTAFTQGLIVAGGTLLESTGRFGASQVRRVELETGRVLDARSLPSGRFGEGLARVGSRLYQLTWKAGRCLVYSLVDLSPVGEFAYEGEGWGLASDGERLLMSDGGPQIQVRDPADFRLVDRILVTDDGEPVTRLNELEWIDGRIWANVWQTTRIAIIAPDDGRVIAWLDLSDLVRRQGPRADVLNGIAYQPGSGRVVVTGKWWPKLYEIRLVPR